MAYGYDAVNTDGGGLLDRAADLINGAGQSLASSIFKSTAHVVNHGLFSVTLTLVACFWVYNKIGREWSKEDFYKAGTWLIMFVCLKVIFAGETYYKGFLEIVHYPIALFYAGIGELSKMVNPDELLEASNAFIGSMWANLSIKDIGTLFLLMILGLLTLLVVWLYILFLSIFIILINLVCAITLSICPIMLPCLIIPKFRGYFFSWLKLYTSTALQPAFATIIAGFMTSMILNQTKTITTQQQQDNFWSNPANVGTAMLDIFLIIILCLVAITLLSKIPQWTQQLIGSGDGEHKTGIAGAIAGAGAMAKQGFKGYTQAKNDMNYKTGGQNGVGRSIASGVASAMGMSGMAQRIAGQTGRDRQGYQERMLQAMQNGGFTATPTPHVEPKNAKNYKA